MKVPKHIYETEKIINTLQKKQLLAQYKKSKDIILSGKIGGSDFKIRHPIHQKIWSFRINKQFRAFGSFDEEGDFIVSTIDNHQ